MSRVPFSLIIIIFIYKDSKDDFEKKSGSYWDHMTSTRFDKKKSLKSTHPGKKVIK